MATLSHAAITKITSLCTKVFLPMVTQVRHGRYHPHFLPPTIDREELSSPLEDSDLRRYRPIKAAETQQSTSIFYDETVQKFTNMVMKMGNKDLAKDIVEKTLENLKHMQVEKYNRASEDERPSIECDPVRLFKAALENCQPVLTLTKVVKGGVAYQVPVACSPKRQRFMAMRWIIDSCRDRQRRIPMENKLAWEIMDAFQNQGKSVRRKQELHRQCEGNKAFAHFRW